MSSLLRTCCGFLAPLAVLLIFAPSAGAAEVKSPNGQIVVSVDVKSSGDKRGCIFYRITSDGRIVLADSQLFLSLEKAPPLEQGFQILKEAASTYDRTWKTTFGERSEIRDRYNQLLVDLVDRQSPPRKMQLLFRAYDEGVAFCYSFPEQEALKQFTIASEQTRFQFTGDHTAWVVYQAQGDYAGKRSPGGPVSLAKIRPGAERPMPVRIADDLYVALAEAGSVDYPRMKFRVAAGLDNALESKLDGPALVTVPYSTPWRVLMVAKTPGKLLEQNYLLLNLNAPCAIEDTSWIKPGKMIRDTTLSTEGGKACVDFCVARNLQYVLFDAGWYGPERDRKSDARTVNVGPRHKPLDLTKVIDYAKSKNIGVFLYVNHVAAEAQLDDLLPLYRKWGVKGVKFGFVNVGPQKWTSWVNEAVRKCAVNHLMVSVHDEYRPSGYERTYPNWMTVEGIGGNEEFPTPIHNASLPFTRCLAGPSDYTFCWYSNRLRNSHAHQLALSVLIYSPLTLLYWYDQPRQYKGDKALEFWDGLPTVWDETRVINGRIGEYATVARRKGMQWWLGTIQAVPGEALTVPLGFLIPGKKYAATVYADANRKGDDPRNVRIETISVDSTTVLRIAIPSNGGHAMRIVPAPE